MCVCVSRGMVMEQRGVKEGLFPVFGLFLPYFKPLVICAHLRTHSEIILKFIKRKTFKKSNIKNEAGTAPRRPSHCERQHSPVWRQTGLGWGQPASTQTNAQSSALFF